MSQDVDCPENRCREDFLCSMANSFFPLVLISERQTSSSRSTTESEVASCAHSLYREGLPALQLWELPLGRSVTVRVLEDHLATIVEVGKSYSPTKSI
jgi:hypothetical protein